MSTFTKYVEQNRIEWNRIEYRSASNAVIHAHNPSPSFVQPLCSCTQQSYTLSKMQYPADWDVLQVTWFHKMLTQVAKSLCGYSLRVTKMCGAVSDACLHLLHPGLSASPTLKKFPFKWQCPVSSPIIIPSWVLLKLSTTQALLAEGHLRKPLAFLCPWMDCPHASCFLIVQFLMTPLTTFVDMWRACSGPTCVCVEPCLANWSAT